MRSKEFSTNISHEEIEDYTKNRIFQNEFKMMAERVDQSMRESFTDEAIKKVKAMGVPPRLNLNNNDYVSSHGPKR